MLQKIRGRKPKSPGDTDAGTDPDSDYIASLKQGIRFVTGKDESSPTHSGPLVEETTSHRDMLVEWHRRGVYTVDSQNDTCSDDKDYKTGEPFTTEQKGYVVGFIPRRYRESMLSHMKKHTDKFWYSFGNHGDADVVSNLPVGATKVAVTVAVFKDPKKTKEYTWVRASNQPLHSLFGWKKKLIPVFEKNTASFTVASREPCGKQDVFGFLNEFIVNNLPVIAAVSR